jgi:small subunit ribosomal protein S11
MIQKTDHQKKKSKNVTFSLIHVKVTSNNTLINFSDTQGNTIVSGSAGMNFKNSKKSTAYAAQVACEALIESAKNHGVKTVDIIIKGIGSQRDSVLRSILGALNVRFIIDKTPIPHNGCRREKRRRA